MPLATILATLLAVCSVLAQSPSAVSLAPSDGWYGIDGNWSTLSFQVGDPSQPVNVLVSTALSEVWVVQSSGCMQQEPLCGNARGNVFTIEDSSSWSALGTWALGLEDLQYGGNGDYGLEMVTPATSDDTEFTLTNAITAAINSTDYYTGFFGLGVAQGRFGEEVQESPLTQAVKDFGHIPSYSYGYTAGAYYKGDSGIPCSLTLGGFDESRFETHNTRFTLGQRGTTPQVLVRAVSVSVPDDEEVPPDWDSRTQVLSSMDTSFEALVDSSTPFLWFPEEVCDEFADAFGLSYNDTLNLYTLNDTQFDQFRSNDAMNFTFSLTSFDNQDDLGDPLNVPGLVNITITAAAFAQVLRYPFMEAIDYGKPSVPYFPLRRSSNSTGDFIIGRSFLQEVYMITRYDSGVFSLHQARFPDDPQNEVDLKQIDQPGNSPFPPPQTSETDQVDDDGSGLGTGQIVGIAIGGAAFVTLWLIALVWYCRRRKRSKPPTEQDEKDGSVSSVDPNTSSTPLAKIISLFTGRKRSQRKSVHEVQGSESQPKEVGADASHAVYELPAPMAPGELDGESENAYNGDTELGTESSQGLTAYEATRRKLDRQLRGPVPAYYPSENAGHLVTDEKTDHAVAHRDPDQQHSTSTNEPSDNSNSLPNNPPSPLSPRDYWNAGFPDTLPSPTTSRTPPLDTSGLPSDPSSNDGSTQRSASSDATALSASARTRPASTSTAGIQRTPIDPSKVICLGPLAENVSVPADSSSPRLEAQAQAHAQQVATGSRSDSSESQERINGGEIVHVPQLAERRFSWEEDR